MAQQLPERANLAHLRKQAKALLARVQHGDAATLEGLPSHLKGKTLKLHDAQSAIARDYGFDSWKAIVDHVEGEEVRNFVFGSWSGEAWWQTGPIEPDPKLAKRSLAVALMTGEVAIVKRALSLDPKLPSRRLQPRDEEPLAHVCFSRGLRNPALLPDLLEIAKLLLRAGANPNAEISFGENREHRISILYGAAGANGCPELTEILLDAGANPNDDESLYHSTEHEDSRCFDMLLARGADPGGNTLAHQLDAERPEPLRKLLAAGAKPDNGELQHAIVMGRSVDTLQVLLGAGADQKALDKHGLTPLEAAVVAKRFDIVAFMRTLDERPLPPASQAVHDALFEGEIHPQPRSDFGPGLGWALAIAADHGDLEGVRNLLAIGIDPDSKNLYSEAPALHHACFKGYLEIVRAIIAAGASFEIRDKYHNGVPLGWACAGSVFKENPHGDFLGVIKLLIQSGHRYRSDKDPAAESFGEGTSEEIQAYLKSVQAT